MKLVLGVYDQRPHPFHYRWIDDSWTLSDIDPRSPNVVKVDARAIPYTDLEAIYASHIVEHIAIEEVPKMLKHWYDVLTPRGYIVINVPDMEWLAREIINVERGEKATSDYFDTINKLMYVIYGPGEGFDQHKSGFTKSTLFAALQDAGFTDVSLEQEFDAHEMGVIIATAKK